MITKHTPGPWSYREIYHRQDPNQSLSSDDYYVYPAITAQKGEKLIATLAEKLAEADAPDARLIAASPDLFGTVERAKYCLNNLVEYLREESKKDESGFTKRLLMTVENNIKNCASAIAKAKGG